MTQEEISIIGDLNCESFKGTGVLPLLPAHNFDDYSVAINFDIKSDVLNIISVILKKINYFYPILRKRVFSKKILMTIFLFFYKKIIKFWISRKLDK